MGDRAVGNGGTVWKWWLADLPLWGRPPKGNRPLNRRYRCINLLHRRNPRFPAILLSMQNL